MVLLKVAWMHTTPCGTTRFSRFLRNSFLRFDGFAPAAGAAAASFGSFATLVPLLLVRRALIRPGAEFRCVYLRAITFFLAATAPFRGPLRVRALVCVRWPRTGRFRRWRK